MNLRESVSIRLAAFLAAAVAVAGGGYSVGQIWGDEVAVDSASHDMATMDATAAVADIPGGLLSTSAGYTVVLKQDAVAAGESTEIAFAIRDADGDAVTKFDLTHERELHLIAARRDLSTFEHLHPTRDASGEWHATINTTKPGIYRLYTDFAAAGSEPVTLGADLQVAGDYVPVPLGEATTTDSVDGYQVTLDGDLVPGVDSTLEFTVSRDGEPVTDLDEYLGAAGHLVALRDKDLAYLHVHPVAADEKDRGPRIRFLVDAPAGNEQYVLNLQFQHLGVVHTARFVVDPAAVTADPSDEADHSAH